MIWTAAVLGAFCLVGIVMVAKQRARARKQARAEQHRHRMYRRTERRRWLHRWLYPNRQLRLTFDREHQLGRRDGAGGR